VEKRSLSVKTFGVSESIYSGRSVIVVGPTLESYTNCVCLKLMALIVQNHLFSNRFENLLDWLHHLKRQEACEKQEPVVWDILEEVIRASVIAGTVRQRCTGWGIQAFEPVLIARQSHFNLHPLVLRSL